MSNLEKYNNIFAEIFNIDSESLENLKYKGIPEWDSVGQMNLIISIEEVFNIHLETESILDFDSYKKGKEILNKNYGLEF